MQNTLLPISDECFCAIEESFQAALAVLTNDGSPESKAAWQASKSLLDLVAEPEGCNSSDEARALLIVVRQFLIVASGDVEGSEIPVLHDTFQLSAKLLCMVEAETLAQPVSTISDQRANLRLLLAPFYGAVEGVEGIRLLNALRSAMKVDEAEVLRALTSLLATDTAPLCRWFAQRAVAVASPDNSLRAHVSHRFPQVQLIARAKKHRRVRVAITDSETPTLLVRRDR